MSLASSFACLLYLAAAASAYVARTVPQGSQPSIDIIPSALQRRATDPTDFGWIEKWAAIGDSFTAGIGSGDLYTQRTPDWKCSRYDYSYPAILNRMFGPGVDEFQFVACSGDKSVDINNQVIGMDVHDQVSHINDELDLVIMTAGGNDLCLSGIITTCILLPFQSEEGCTAILAKAQSNIDSILKENLRSILYSLNDKLKDGGVVIYNLYAEFFNEENEECATQQDWSFPKIIWFNGLKLTVARRKKFNALVTGINTAIEDVVDEISANKTIKYKIATSDWNPWPKEGVDGQMCESGATGKYPDPKSPDLQFFKPDSSTYTSTSTTKRDITQEEEAYIETQRKRFEVTDKDIYDSLLYVTPDSRAVARHLLNPRAPLPPNCPGDGGSGPFFGLGLPDRWGRFFHPNEKGHETIAAFAMEAMIRVRSEQLGVANPVCAVPKDSFKCWQKDGRTAYAAVDLMDANYKDFCNTLSPPADVTGWKVEKTYYKGTPEEHMFRLQLGAGAAAYSKSECLAVMNRIIHGCDGNDPENPLNWKFGGQRIKGEYTYEAHVAQAHRPWPPMKERGGKCEGWYKAGASYYTIYGHGWATTDWGQKTLDNIKGCVGLGVTEWDFEYFDRADEDGNEWKMYFHTPIWVRARCFKNNKVVMGAGGFTDGCAGNDW